MFEMTIIKLQSRLVFLRLHGNTNNWWSHLRIILLSDLTHLLGPDCVGRHQSSHSLPGSFLASGIRVQPNNAGRGAGSGMYNLLLCTDCALHSDVRPVFIKALSIDDIFLIFKFQEFAHKTDLIGFHCLK